MRISPLLDGNNFHGWVIGRHPFGSPQTTVSAPTLLMAVVAYIRLQFAAHMT